MDIDSPGMLRHEASGICLLADVIAKSALKCGAQVTGGYFSDPGFKDVPEPFSVKLARKILPKAGKKNRLFLQAKSSDVRIFFY